MRHKLVFGVLLAVLAGPFLSGSAGAVVLTFSEPDFEWVATAGPATPYHIWSTGDVWRQNFIGTGLAEAGLLTLELEIDDTGSETLNLDLFVNSVDVGDFSLNPADLGLQTFTFGFAPVAGDSYLLEMVPTNTLSFGAGSYSIFLVGGLSRATLAQIPEPATLTVLGLGLAGFIGFRRRRGSR